MPRVPASSIDKIIGANIRRRRNELNISAGKLGSALGISYQQVLKYESAENKMAASLLYVVAHQLQMPMKDFFEVRREILEQAWGD